MSTIPENWNLIFYAEGDDAVVLIDLIDEEDEAAAIDQVVTGKLDDLEGEDIPEPEDDDEIFESDDGFAMVTDRRLERVWVYELTDYDEDVL